MASAKRYFAGMGISAISSIVKIVAVNFVPFLVDRHIDGSYKFCRPLPFSNYLIAHVCQLCHHLAVVIDGLDQLYMLRPSDPGALLLLVCVIDFVTSAGRTAGILGLSHCLVVQAIQHGLSDLSNTAYTD